MRIFISGGCKNGKSYFAQRLAKEQCRRAGGEKLYYIATMQSTDTEDDERIARHREERAGWGFTTVEHPAGIEGILEICDASGSFLLDSATALLANEMFPPGGPIDEHAAEKVVGGLMEVLRCVGNIVVVSDYIYSDAAPYDPLSEQYRASLAKIDLELARACDVVLEVVYTNVVTHKSVPAYAELSDSLARRSP